MYRLIAIMISCTPLLTCGQTLSTQNPRELAFQLQEVLHLKDSYMSCYTAQVEYIRSVMSKYNTGSAAVDIKELLPIIETTFSWDAQKDNFADIYLKLYSPEELRDMIIFFSSTAGQKFLTSNIEIVNEFVRLSSLMAERALSASDKGTQILVPLPLEDISTRDNPYRAQVLTVKGGEVRTNYIDDWRTFTNR